MDRGAKRSAQCLKSEASRFRPRAGVAETDRLSVFRVTLAFSETSQLSLVLRGLGLMETCAIHYFCAGVQRCRWGLEPGGWQNEPATRARSVGTAAANPQDCVEDGSIRRIGGPTSANFSPIRSAVTSRKLSGSASPLNNFGGSGCLSFSSGFDIRATPFESNIWAVHCR
jgi:hypothetical protein